MAGENEFAFSHCRSIRRGGGAVPESGQKQLEKCLPAGTGAKILSVDLFMRSCNCTSYLQSRNSPLEESKLDVACLRGARTLP